MIGIIYKIVCNETGEIYFGSTKQSFNTRISEHKRHYKCWKAGNKRAVASCSIIDRGNYSCSLVETVEFDDRSQLEDVERRYIVTTNKCINKAIPGGHRSNQSHIKYDYKNAYEDILKQFEALKKQMAEQII